MSVATPGRRLALLVIAAALASAPADAAVKPTAGAASTRAAVKPTAGATITRAAAKPTAGGAITRAAAKPRVLSPRARCARAARVARARRRAVLRRACARLRSPRVVGRSVAQEAGLPAALTVPATFAPAPAAVEGSPSPAATPAPATDGTSLPPIYSNPYAVQVQAFEFGFQLSKARVSAGDVHVEFNLSRAEDPHNLVLVRADGTGPLYDFDQQPSGAVVAKTLPLTPGRWTLFCSLPNHQAQGMQATLTVG